MEFIELLVKIAKILERLKIEYCVTGGYAISVWGRPRSTFDIDVVALLKERQVASFLKQLRLISRAGYLDESLVSETVRSGGEFNFIHPESGLKIDFWVIKKNDKIGAGELKRRLAKTIDGQKIFFISPEDLILSKLRWYRDGRSTRHLEDIDSILKISKIDLKYVKIEAGRQLTADILRGLLKNK